jgi:hypothetical protein
MADVKLSYVTWRNGRPRFKPSARERALGFDDEDLRHGPGGPWYTLDEANAWADARYQEILQARATGQRRKPVASTIAEDTVEGLIEDWLRALKAELDPEEKLSPAGIESYEKAARATIYQPETRAQAAERRKRERAAELLGLDKPERPRELFASKPPRVVDDIELRGFYDYLKRLRGHHMARAAIRLRLGTRPETVIVDEVTGAPYAQSTYRHVFGKVRALAIKGSNEFALAPCPSLTYVGEDGKQMFKRDQDLRDTAVTWLARAGCTVAEICAITGHSNKSVQTIIAHYLGSARELADAGIEKLVAWMQREGIAV